MPKQNSLSDIIFERMQDAVDHVHASEHQDNKISACLFDPHNPKLMSVHVNHRPPLFQANFTPDIRIGNSSQFIHAETACIFDFDSGVEGCALCITDPFCPNCAKAIAESGIRDVYIDHKGLDKDFAKRRGDDFESLSLLMMEKAGINVSIVHRKDRRIEPLVSHPIATRIAGGSGIEFFDDVKNLKIEDLIASFRKRQPHTAWAVAKIKEPSGKISGILVFEGLPLGMTPVDYQGKQHLSTKYRFPVDPVNRLYFYLQRKSLVLLNDEIGCNLFPSSRALVNSVGIGIKKITVGEENPDHESDGHSAATILEESGILIIKRLY